MSEIEKSNPGATFKVSREKLGLSINDVAVATKINPRILRALEEGDRAGLPATSFARGFIRSYAAYLKIDAQPILDAFSSSEQTSAATTAALPADPIAAPVAPDTSEKTHATPAPKKAKKISAFHDASATSKALLAVGILLIIGMIFGVRKVINKYAQERVIEPVVATPEMTTTPDEGAPADDSAPTPTETAATDAAAPATEPPAPTTPAPTETKPVAEVKPVPAPPEPKPAEPKVAAENPAPPPAPAPAPTITPPATTSPQEVILEALDAVEVRAVIDGVSEKIQLKPESVHTIKAKNSIQLEIADGGMVNIIHNGRERGVPGDLGKPTKVKYP